MPQPATSPLDCISYGVPFRVAADDPRLLGALLELLPYQTTFTDPSTANPAIFSLVSPSPSHGFCLTLNDDPVFEAPELLPVLERLRSDLMVHVADHAPDYVFVHAGVVGWHGQAIVLPGPSLAGKTTLVAELVKLGASYYSDEYAVLDAEGQVHPYARDLQMRQPGSLDQRSLPVTSLSGVPGTDPLPVSRVLFAHFEPGAVWLPEPVTPGLAVLEMLTHAIPVQRTPQRVMATLTRMMRNATAWRSPRGEAAATAATILVSTP